MPADAFESLRAVDVPVAPRRAFADGLRRRLERRGPVTVVPPGYTDLTPYLCVTDSRRAIEWYGEAFGAEVAVEPIVMDDGRVGHCELRIGDAVFQMADEFPEIGVVAPRPDQSTVSFTLYVADVDAVYTRAVDLGAVGARPPEDQFYGSRAGTIVDPFGHRWTLSTWLGDH